MLCKIAAVARWYVAAAILCAMILTWSLKLWRADLRIPFDYRGDSLLNFLLVKGIIENGWYLRNGQVGAPGGLHLHDFPCAANGDLAVLKVMTWFSSDPALVINSFFLLTFPLVAFTAIPVFRHFGLSYPTALAGGLLFAFTPFHLLRGEGHLFLSSYYPVPLGVLLALWVFLDVPIFAPRARAGLSARGWVALATCFLLAVAMPYFAVFTVFFLLVAGITSSLYRKSRSPLAKAAVLTVLIGLGLGANLTPNWMYALRHGSNPKIDRCPESAESYGLKVTQLLFPVSGHRSEFLAQWKLHYNEHTPAIGENDSATLGVVAAAGFLILMARLFRLRMAAQELRLFDGLTVFNLFALLLGTMGGFGSVACFLITPWIRAYTRISIFIAFISLLAILLLIDRLIRIVAGWPRGRLIQGAVLALVLGVGIWDSATRSGKPHYFYIQEEFDSDRQFIEQIQACLPPQAKIYQLPAMTFPESPPVGTLKSYDHLRGYVHSRTLRWSFPTMRGRPEDLWQVAMTILAPADLVARLKLEGFSGIYLNRHGYYEEGTATMEKALIQALGIKPLESPNRRLCFFPLVGLP
jgi:phosphoglycerol transferase